MLVIEIRSYLGAVPADDEITLGVDQVGPRSTGALAEVGRGRIKLCETCLPDGEAVATRRVACYRPRVGEVVHSDSAVRLSDAKTLGKRAAHFHGGNIESGPVIKKTCAMYCAAPELHVGSGLKAKFVKSG